MVRNNIFYKCSVKTAVKVHHRISAMISKLKFRFDKNIHSFYNKRKALNIFHTKFILDFKKRNTDKSILSLVIYIHRSHTQRVAVIYLQWKLLKYSNVDQF